MSDSSPNRPSLTNTLGRVGKHGGLAAKYGVEQARWGMRVNPPEVTREIENAIAETRTVYPDDEPPGFDATRAERLAYSQRESWLAVVAALNLSELSAVDDAFDQLADDVETITDAVNENDEDDSL